MFQRVLVPVDLSEKSRACVERAADAASAAAGWVALLHVIETIQDVPFEELEDFYRPLRQRAEEVLEGWASELARRGVEARREIVFGRRVPEILRYADENDCDLIVMTSHQLDPDAPGRGLATISHQVAWLARASVLLVR